MHREHLVIEAPDLPHPGALLRFGHAGRPVLAFPTELGRAWEWEDEGMVGAIAPLIEEGQVMLFCVDTYDAFTWSDRGIPAEERARRYRAYERWLVHHVVPRVHEHVKVFQAGAGIGDLLQQLLGPFDVGVPLGRSADELGSLDDLDVRGHGFRLRGRRLHHRTKV